LSHSIFDIYKDQEKRGGEDSARRLLRRLLQTTSDYVAQPQSQQPQIQSLFEDTSAIDPSSFVEAGAANNFKVTVGKLPIPKRNRTLKKEVVLSEEEVALVRSVEFMDTMIFQRGKELFEQRLNALRELQKHSTEQQKDAAG